MADRQVLGWAATADDREVLDWLQAHLGLCSRGEVLRVALREAARSRGWAPGSAPSAPPLPADAVEPLPSKTDAA